MASVVGLGFVGSAILKSFQEKNIQPLVGYDKFKDGGIGSLGSCLSTPVMFICLPTLFNEETKEYDKRPIYETMTKLSENAYPGVVVIKSTVEPCTTEKLSSAYPKLSILHNPEFLSAATAYEDFHGQKHIVLGQGSNCSDDQVQSVYDLYHNNYPEAEISICTASESESMKCYVNCFYAVKIQFFNELYLLCQHDGTDYNTVKDLMLKNNWINPMHTSVPGRDGKLSYGGGCFPKDTNALLQCMKDKDIPHAVLEGCIIERNVMRGVNSAEFYNNNVVEIKKKAHAETNGYNDHMANGSSTNEVEN